MNMAIEADDTLPALRAKARDAMEEWREYIRRTVKRGKEKGEIRREVNGDMLSVMYISLMQGAIMQADCMGVSIR